jgi:hypothetical protein
MHFAYCLFKIQGVSRRTGPFSLNFKANTLNNETHILLFIGLARSEILNVVLFYICNVQTAYNPKSNRNF